jgi:hypothetical protein
LLTGAEQIVAAGPEAPRRPSISPDVLAWEASDGATNVVRVLVAGITKTLSGPFVHAGEPRATSGAVVFTGWLQSGESGDTDVFLFDVGSGDVSLILGGLGQQRFADASPSHVAVSDFSEDPAGIYTGDGSNLSNVVVVDRSTLTPTTLELPGKQAFPMLDGQRLAYLDWLEVHPMPKLHQYELHSVPLASLGDEPTLVADDASTVRRVLSFVGGLAPETRFFAVYSPISGHHPYKSPGTGPRPFAANNDFDHYLNDLHAGDAAFGDLVRGIRELGRERNVLWAIVGDHGQAFGQHEGNFAHTLFLYEENVHVPMLFVAPGSLSSSLRAPQVSSLIDLAPATLDLLGLRIPESYRGRSPLLPSPSVARFFTDHGPTKLGLRQGSWKVLHETEHDRTRLFDLSTDPGEQRDVAGEHPERARRYRDHLRAFAAAERARVLK